MAGKDLSDRLSWARRRAGFSSTHKAAEEFGWNQNTYNSHDDGLRTPRKHDVIQRYAKAFAVDFIWLLTGQGSFERRDLVRVSGRIGAGAEISPEIDQSEDQYAEVSFPTSESALAFEVIGDSMWPRYDPGDLIICKTQVESRDAADGIEAAVLTEDGRRYLKTVRRVSEDTFDLESYNARPIRNVRLEWVAKVVIVAKAGEWKWVETANASLETTPNKKRLRGA
jgi:phage repressor protein C with HTH and peptisase S24 domain